MNTLEHPWLLLLGLMLPLLAWRALLRDRRAGRPFPGLGLAATLRPTWRTRLRALPLALRLVALAALIVAVARPQLTQGWTSVSTEGVAIQIVFDRSGSMREPIDQGDGRTTTRMDVARRAVQNFALGNGKELGGRRGDLLGFIAFARYADTLAPLSRSTQQIADLAARLEPVAARPEDGTAIGDALALAAARLKRAEEELSRSRDGDHAAPDFTIRSKVIILMTDGENNAGERTPEEAAAMAKSWGIRIYTIGIGAGAASSFGAFPFPIGRMDDRLLKDIAAITDGRYFAAGDASALMDAYAAIDGLERTKFDSREHSRRTEKYLLFASVAAAALLLEFLLASTLLRRAG